MQSYFQRNRVLLLHLSFWCVYLSFSVYQISSYRRREVDFSSAFMFASTQVIFNMIVAYMNFFYQLPRFLVRKKIWLYLIEFFIPFTILIILRVMLQRYMIDGYTYQEKYFYSPVYVVQLVVITIFIVVFVSMLRFAVDWFEFEAKKKAVENEKLTAELNFLKAQINPHFLFNTLNNLYYLAYSKSENTTEVVARLSQMMRYMIYDSNAPRVLMSKEIEYIESYISLERLRLNNQIPIDLKIEGDVNTALITPFILITFLENAFKHGVTNNNPNSWVKILVKVEGNQCLYTVSNSKIASAQLDNGGKSGIGLQNVHRRLELSYPSQYELKVNDTTDQYTVQLKLTLS